MSEIRQGEVPDIHCSDISALNKMKGGKMRK
jgi:hypothetical protein